ncbi:MAG: hypothetical protein ISR87_15010 [Candidatus Marinimicrobia bacterium]|nr:hypothetical protein [Candidatus Neomarinimicrobiota bacterium]
METCLTSAQLERLALDQLSSRRIVLPPHLTVCNLCQSALTELVTFYEAVQDEYKRIAETNTLQTLEAHLSNKPSGIYKFDALHLLPLPRQIPEYKHALVADSGVEASPQGTKSISVFASADGQLMIRVLRDPKNEYTLFLIADSEALYANVLVHIIGMDREYVTDGQGRIHLGKIDLPPIEKLGVEVRTASDSYDLKQLFIAQKTQLGAGEIILERGDSRKIKLEITPAGSQYHLKVTLEAHALHSDLEQVRVMVIRENGQRLIQSTRRGVALFQELDHPTDLQVKIFE